MNDLGDLFRGMAGEGPSDEGLLEGVHAASARAEVRRRVLVSSAAALALVLAGIGVATATGSNGPRVRDQVFGASDTPQPGDTTAPGVVPSGDPSASDAPSSDTYHGRAVSPDGDPISGLYVYAFGSNPSWTGGKLATRTQGDGSFDLPCPKGPVLLNAFALGEAVPSDSPNWRTTFVGGGFLLDKADRPSCVTKRESTVVPTGAVLHGSVTGPVPCPLGDGLAVYVTVDGPDGHLAYDQTWLRTEVRPGEQYRLAGLPTGSSYAVRLFGGGLIHPLPDGGRSDQVIGPGRTEVDWILDAEQCAQGRATPTPDATPEPTSEPSSTAEPAPSAAPSS